MAMYNLSTRIANLKALFYVLVGNKGETKCGLKKKKSALPLCFGTSLF